MGTFSTVIGDGLYRVETRTHEPNRGDVVTELNIFSIAQEEALLRGGRSNRMARAGAQCVQAQLLDSEIEDLVVFVAQLAARHGRERRGALKALLDVAAHDAATAANPYSGTSRGDDPLPSVQELVDVIEATTPEDPDDDPEAA